MQYIYINTIHAKERDYKAQPSRFKKKKKKRILKNEKYGK